MQRDNRVIAEETALLTNEIKERSASPGSSVLGAVVVAFLCAVALLVIERVFGGAWRSLWSFLSTWLLFILGVVPLAMCGSSKLPAASSLGMAYGAGCGFLYSLACGYGLPSVFFGTCIGNAVGYAVNSFGRPQNLIAPQSRLNPRLAGAVAIAVILLHVVGVLTPTRLVRVKDGPVSPLVEGRKADDCDVRVNLVLASDFADAAWQVEELQDPPQAFHDIPQASRKGDRRVTYKGEQRGGVTAFEYSTASEANAACDKILKGIKESPYSPMSKLEGIGDKAYGRSVSLNGIPVLATVLFVEGRIAVFVELLGCTLEEITQVAKRISQRMRRSDSPATVDISPNASRSGISCGRTYSTEEIIALCEKASQIELWADGDKSLSLLGQPTVTRMGGERVWYDWLVDVSDKRHRVTIGIEEGLVQSIDLRNGRLFAQDQMISLLKKAQTIRLGESRQDVLRAMGSPSSEERIAMRVVEAVDIVTEQVTSKNRTFNIITWQSADNEGRSVLVSFDGGRVDSVRCHQPSRGVVYKLE